MRQFDSDPTQPIPVVTTSSYAALQLFAQAVSNVSSQSTAAERSTSIELLRKALALDSEFPMARIWLALTLKSADISRVSDHDGILGPAELYLGHAREAQTRANGLSREEQLFIEGATNTLLERDVAAIAAFEVLVSSTPHLFESQARLILSSLYLRQGRYSEYADQAVRIADLLPKDFNRTFKAAEAVIVHDGDIRRAAPS